MINCKEIAKNHKDAMKRYLEARKISPTLAVIQVGDNPASNSYIKGKKADCAEVGVKFLHIRYDTNVTTDILVKKIHSLNRMPFVKGIIVQLPLPKHLDKDKILNAVVDDKDVDGFKLDSPYRSCTAKGIAIILDHIGFNPDGKVCCVIGRGDVGIPVVGMLTGMNATIIWCNSHTPKDVLSKLCRQADLVVSAAGVPGLIDEIRDNEQVVIDVGITRGEDGKLHGDVDPSCYDEECMITPVPGGVGLMTRVALLENVVYGA